MGDYGLADADRGPVLFKKTPDERIRIPFEWAALLDGATVTSVAYELPDGLTNAANGGTGTSRNIEVSGGDDGRNYRVISKCTASDGRILEQVKRVTVKEG